MFMEFFEMVLDYDIFIYELRKYNFFIKGFLRGFAQFKAFLEEPIFE